MQHYTRKNFNMIYAWITPAFVRNSIVDHTWVTSYDPRANQYQDIAAVEGNNESFWYCHGDFRPDTQGEGPIAKGLEMGPASCLVTPNDRLAFGTVPWYGIDGVCHQVSNQVLHAASPFGSGWYPLTVYKARGYKLSTSLFGTYGRREEEWDFSRRRCGFAAINLPRRRIHLFVRRLANALSCSFTDMRVQRLELERRHGLSDIDQIGFAIQSANESPQVRVSRLNGRINQFLGRAAEDLNEDTYFYVFGIPKREEFFLIDPELFEFPPEGSLPERSELLGW